MYVQRKRQT